MDLCLAILLVFYIISIIVSMILDKKSRDLTQEVLNFNSKLIEERRKLLDIIIDAEINNEQSYFTLEKIKELVKNCESNN